jgi:hypothetical protein
MMSAWNASSRSDSAVARGSRTENSLPLKLRSDGTRSTIASDFAGSGRPSNSGATTSTSWPSRKYSSANVLTERATPPTWGR